jgi:hypothetical protein
VEASVTANTIPAGIAPLFAVTLAAQAITPRPFLPATLLAVFPSVTAVFSPRDPQTVLNFGLVKDSFRPPTVKVKMNPGKNFFSFN